MEKFSQTFQRATIAAAVGMPTERGAICLRAMTVRRDIWETEGSRFSRRFALGVDGHWMDPISVSSVLTSSL